MNWCSSILFAAVLRFNIPALCKLLIFVTKPVSMKRKLLFFFLILLQQSLLAQEKPAADSAVNMNELVVTAFEQNRMVSGGTIVKIISSTNADRYNKTSLVAAFNAVPGVRMEERSPGSYRINVRGSSLRSPFGVRNVKVYWNDIPVTDAGGNTYFNQFAFNNFSSIEIVKGPAGSMYGAGTGGAILMHSFGNAWKPSVNLEYIAGSYGLQNILSSVNFGQKSNRNSITFAHNESDGYRDHTKTKKDNLSFISQLKISERQQLTASILYNNLFYETPGALTKAEFTANPKQSRPAAGGLPSALAVNAAIYQKNFVAGINQQYQFTKAFKNSTSIYGAFTQFTNPTFRDYERRNEPGFGGRTSFVYDKKINETAFQLVLGGELQKGFFNALVSKIKNGNADTLLTEDDINYTNYSLFAQADINFNESWIVTAGASINKTKLEFTRLNAYPVKLQTRIYKNELSPRIALQKILSVNNTIFASISKGFSPPTLAELLPSTSSINTALEAEQGLNYELGARFSALKNKLHAEITGFYFKLDNALVSRKDSSNADYFVNAGNTKQRGVELSADYTSTFRNTILDYIIIRSGFTLNDFKYGSFQKGTTSFSGKDLPGVPKNALSLSADIQFKNGIYFNSLYYYSDKTFLDDANTATANHYNLLGGRLGCKFFVKEKLKLNFYAGADNLLNETYSLGNDFNAAAGRYYNVAPGRNFYAGISIQLDHAKSKK
jgi:iron complex outermembrane receptor protein